MKDDQFLVTVKRLIAEAGFDDAFCGLHHPAGRAAVKVTLPVFAEIEIGEEELVADDGAKVKDLVETAVALLRQGVLAQAVKINKRAAEDAEKK